MKLSKMLSLFFILVMCGISFSTVAYAEADMKVNGQKASEGDIVTYEFYMSGVSNPIEAVSGYITYNSDYLEYIDGSIGFDVLKSAMINEGQSSIYYCAIDIYDGFDFSSEALVVTASFRVLDDSLPSTVIEHAFDEIFTFENEEEDLTDSDYESREATLVNAGSDNSARYSAVNANDITETSYVPMQQDTDIPSETENSGLSVMLAWVGGVALVCAALITVAVIIRKRKN